MTPTPAIYCVLSLALVLCISGAAEAAGNESDHNAKYPLPFIQPGMNMTLEDWINKGMKKNHTYLEDLVRFPPCVPLMKFKQPSSTCDVNSIPKKNACLTFYSGDLECLSTLLTYIGSERSEFLYIFNQRPGVSPLGSAPKYGKHDTLAKRAGPFMDGGVIPLDWYPSNIVRIYTVNGNVPKSESRVVQLPLGLRKGRGPIVTGVATTSSDAIGTRDLAFCGLLSTGKRYKRYGTLRNSVLSRCAKQQDFLNSRTEAHTSNNLSLYLKFVIARHKLIYSPEGTGIDCWRHWESLALGTVPIIQHSSAMDQFEGLLPFVFTDNYGEFTSPESLLKAYEALQPTKKLYSFELLMQSYWYKLFMADYNAYIQPSGS